MVDTHFYSKEHQRIECCSAFPEYGEEYQARGLHFTVTKRYEILGVGGLLPEATFHKGQYSLVYKNLCFQVMDDKGTLCVVYGNDYNFQLVSVGPKAYQVSMQQQLDQSVYGVKTLFGNVIKGQSEDALKTCDSFITPEGFEAYKAQQAQFVDENDNSFNESVMDADAVQAREEDAWADAQDAAAEMDCNETCKWRPESGNDFANDSGDWTPNE